MSRDVSAVPPNSMPSALEHLDAACDTALATEWCQLSGPELATAVAAVSAITAKVDAVRTRVAAAVDSTGVWAEGEHANAAAFVRSQLPNRHPAEAGLAVQCGRRLLQMPLVAAAFEAGTLTTAHVRLLGECLAPRFGGLFCQFEAELVRHATELSFAAFRTLIARWKDWAADASGTERERRDARVREVHLSRTFNDRGELRGTLTPVARSIVGRELQRLEQCLFEHDWAAATERMGEGNVTRDSLRRTAAQRRHDALVWMAMRSAVLDDDTTGPDREPAMYVHTSEADLAAALAEDAGEAAERVPYDESMRELEDGTPVSRRLLVRWLIRAKVRRLVFGPRGEVIDAGRSARFFTRGQRDVIAARDRVCQCGCGLSARYCDMDHIVEWRHGGTTSIANARPACRPSHRLKTGHHSQRPPPPRE